MLIHVNIQKEAVDSLRQMAKEAGVGLHDMVEIGAYNLVALWMRERGDTTAVVPDDGMAGATVMDHVEVFRVIRVPNGSK